MTWCPLLCYPLSPSPVNIERLLKLGAKFCRKKISTASSFATGQKEFLHYFHNLDIILQHSDIDVEIIEDIICPTSEEDSCTWFLQALSVRDPVFMK